MDAAVIDSYEALARLSPLTADSEEPDAVRCVEVYAAAGLGRTWLTRAVIARARSRGLLVCSASGESLKAGSTTELFHHLDRQLARAMDLTAGDGGSPVLADGDLDGRLSAALDERPVLIVATNKQNFTFPEYSQNLKNFYLLLPLPLPNPN